MVITSSNQAKVEIACLPYSIYLIKAKYGNEEFISKFVKD